ncbi:hypothetical protein E3J74_04510 [Candidatus Bathyarchaeota archaeon]|nr:MAG: hypothetical protein E3J74_04510 [Candidatus Bathyarchaeota archaeon]
MLSLDDFNIGDGFIYNDYSGRGATGKEYNILHIAFCNWVTRSKANIPKYFFNNIDEAIKWLSINRRGNWKRCGSCLAKTRLPSRVPRESEIPQVRSVPARSKVFTEAEVENILIQFLEGNGYKIRRQVRAPSGIIDVVAEKEGKKLLIEAKGEDRGGYTSTEMNFQMGLGQLMSRMKHRDAGYGLAFPLTKDFMKVLRRYKGSFAFEKLGIYLILVKRDGSCQLVSSSDVLKFLDEIATSS